MCSVLAKRVCDDMESNWGKDLHNNNIEDNHTDIHSGLSKRVCDDFDVRKSKSTPQKMAHSDAASIQTNDGNETSYVTQK